MRKTEKSWMGQAAASRRSSSTARRTSRTSRSSSTGASAVCLQGFLEFQTISSPLYQRAPVVNYRGDEPFTRVTEFKYLTGQESSKTTVVVEYPRAEGDPYYPVPCPENAALYRRYQALADQTPDVAFVGRLATYRYYNMDQVVAQALSVFDRLAGTKPVRGVGAPAPTELTAVAVRGV